MTQSAQKEIIRDEKTGQIISAPGRQKGSKNKLTLQKMAIQSGLVENNYAKIEGVLNIILDQALEGHAGSQKLVWNTFAPNSTPDENTAQEKVVINISGPDESEKVIN